MIGAHAPPLDGHPSRDRQLLSKRAEAFANARSFQARTALVSPRSPTLGDPFRSAVQQVISITSSQTQKESEKYFAIFGLNIARGIFGPNGIFDKVS